MFRPSLTKRDTFRPAQPKLLCFDQVWPSEIRFDRRDQNIYVSTKFGQAGYVSTGATKTFMFWPSSTKFNQARYVLTCATKTTRFRPSSTKRDTFRPAQPKLLCFDQVRPSLTKRETFRPARPKQLGFDQVQPSEIRFDRRDQSN